MTLFRGGCIYMMYIRRGAMGKEYDTRSFKSGNSVAIRIPAALGVEPDRDWTVAEDENGDLVIRLKRAPKKKFNIQKVAGCAIGSGMRPIEAGGAQRRSLRNSLTST